MTLNQMRQWEPAPGGADSRFFTLQKKLLPTEKTYSVENGTKAWAALFSSR